MELGSEVLDCVTKALRVVRHLEAFRIMGSG